MAELEGADKKATVNAVAAWKDTQSNNSTWAARQTFEWLGYSRITMIVLFSIC